MTAAAVVVDWTVVCTVARSHGTRAPTSRANRMSRVRVARSRVRPMVRLYIAHVGVDPPQWGDCGGRRCGLDGGLHRGSFARHRGLDPTLRPHGPFSVEPSAYHDESGGLPVPQWDSIYVDGATCQVDKRGLLNLKLKKTSFYI